MATVIERHGHSIDAAGFIHHDDRPATYEQADRQAGRRLDRRRNYAIIDGLVAESCQWSHACSGCYEGHNIDSGTGNGCNECGYTGRRRSGAWVPLTAKQEQSK
jgi:hypothetical protein